MTPGPFKPPGSAAFPGSCSRTGEINSLSPGCLLVGKAVMSHGDAGSSWGLGIHGNSSFPRAQAQVLCTKSNSFSSADSFHARARRALLDQSQINDFFAQLTLSANTWSCQRVCQAARGCQGAQPLPSAPVKPCPKGGIISQSFLRGTGTDSSSSPGSAQLCRSPGDSGCCC